MNRSQSAGRVGRTSGPGGQGLHSSAAGSGEVEEEPPDEPAEPTPGTEAAAKPRVRKTNPGSGIGLVARCALCPRSTVPEARGIQDARKDCLEIIRCEGKGGECRRRPIQERFGGEGRRGEHLKR